jgi:tetratricopeptide (TPR) repeat protein
MTEPDPVLARLNRLLTYVAIDPGNLILRKDSINEACDRGQWETAQRLIRTGLQLHANEPDLLVLCALVNFHVQSYAEAEQALAAARTLGIEVPELKYNLALVLFMQKRYADALDAMQEASVADTVPQALLLRARCLHHLNRPAEAVAQCRAHLALAPGDAETHGVLALLLYEQGLLDEAKRHAAAALQLDEAQLEGLLALASMQADAREYEAARGSFGTLVQAHPHCGRAWLGLALIDLSHLQFEPALSHCERATACMPQHIGTWHVMAWGHLMQGNASAARAAFEAALSLDRNFGETHGGLAVVAALEGQEEEARLNIKRASRLDSQSMSMQYAQMLLLQREGKDAQARALLESVLARPVASGDLLYRDLVSAQASYLRLCKAGRRDSVYH